MKKPLVLIICICFAIASVFAWQNTYTSETEEYKLLVYLSNLSEVSAPIMVSPISSDQMLNILESIDVSLLDDVSKAYYDLLKDKLENPKTLLNYDNNLLANGWTDVSVQFSKQSENESDFMIAKKDRKPMLEFGAEIFFDKNIYSNFTFDMTDVGLGFDRDNKKFSKYDINYTLKYDEIDFSTPHRAFVSMGGGTARSAHFNIIVGRDKLNFGNGETGNLCLGSTLWYHDFVKASVINKVLSFDTTVLSFSNSVGSTETEHIEDPFGLSFNPLFEEPHQLVFLHNLSFEPVKQFSFSIYEGALVYGDSSISDLRNLNPMFVLHNTFEYMIGGTKGGTNAGNMNNFFGCEARYVFKGGWTVDVQAFFDQIQFNDEKSPEEPQPAIGFLANISKTANLFNGLAHFYLEGVYTSPNLYLKEDQVACGEYWNLDLIVGNIIFWTPSNNDVSYLGHKFGPDTFAIQTGFDWNNYKNLKLGFSALYKFHGRQGAMFYEGQNDKTLEMGEDLKSDIITSPTERRLALKLNASYDPSKLISFDAALGYQKAWNYHNITNLISYQDVQFAVAVTLHPMSLINKK